MAADQSTSTVSTSDPEGGYEIVEPSFALSLTLQQEHDSGGSSDEKLLSEALSFMPKKKYNHDDLIWIIPEVDSDSEHVTAADPAANTQLTVTAKPRRSKGAPRIHVELPSDSEEDEDLYDSVRSPTFSAGSIEPPLPPLPPLPPPLSSIPSKFHMLQTLGSRGPPGSGFMMNQSISASVPSNIGQLGNSPGRQTVSTDRLNVPRTPVTQDADTYDVIEPRSFLSLAGRDPKAFFATLQNQEKSNLAEANAESNEAKDDLYAQILKQSMEKSQDMKTSSHNRSEGDLCQASPRTQRALIQRQHSVTSDYEQGPIIPPKLWEKELSTPQDSTLNSGYGTGQRDNSQSPVTADEQDDNDDEGITMEYNPLYCSNDSPGGSLVRPDDDDYYVPERDDSEAGDADGSSVLSEKEGVYEQTSACVDLDQLSVDGSGHAPRRIVETHETHEIIPSGNDDDDIVERIIETQTITEKLDDNLIVKDYSGEDYSKYLEDDDEFVSHIFTLGRTIEKGNGNKRKSKSLDFAFVENPFRPNQPAMETTPIEKKTVKQKITTLVKKKKVNQDDAIYAEVVSGAQSEDGLQTGGHYENDLADSYSHRSVPEAGSAGQSNDDTPRAAESLLYEAVAAPQETTRKKSGKKRSAVARTRSLFSGIKRFLLRKHKTQPQEPASDATNGSVLLVEDDYQEFVP